MGWLSRHLERAASRTWVLLLLAAIEIVFVVALLMLALQLGDL